MRYLFAFIAILVLGGVVFWWNRGEVLAPAINTEQQIATATINGNVLELEVVRTAAEQARGLSGRALLAENAGMLFVSKEPGIPGFWMKDMQFALDIVWIDENKTIVGIEENVPPETYPEIFYPPSPVLYVLEVNAGWAEARGVSAGDEVILDF